MLTSRSPPKIAVISAAELEGTASRAGVAVVTAGATDIDPTTKAGSPADADRSATVAFSGDADAGALAIAGASFDAPAAACVFALALAVPGA